MSLIRTPPEPPPLARAIPESKPSLYPHPFSKALSRKPLGPMRSPARVLGWFSIGLGAAQLAMPKAMSRVVGGTVSPGLVRAYGARELAVGVGLLNSKNPTPWLVGRVAGDALDLATVATGLAGPRKTATLVSLAALAGLTWIDTLVAGAARKGPKVAPHDYSRRSGFPKSPDEMRGAAVQTG